jgi:hypothetical protein
MSAIGYGLRRLQVEALRAFAHPFVDRQANGARPAMRMMLGME